MNASHATSLEVSKYHAIPCRNDSHLIKALVHSKIQVRDGTNDSNESNKTCAYCILSQLAPDSAAEIRR